ncbi:MAG: collagen-like protein [Candidatus Poribacteria bacterium]|nr:collagen-like protein [Candidatus Poribacteria bacterium]
MKKLLMAIFVISLSIIGCEIPYTGPMLTVDHVDQYLHRTGQDNVCLQDGFDSICIKVIPGTQGPRGTEGRRGPQGPQGEPGSPGVNAPIIHIHERSIIYEFYYENKLALRAETQVDTSELLELLATQQGDQDDGGNNDGPTVPTVQSVTRQKVGWTVWITYPDIDGDGLGDTPERAGTNFNVDTGLQVTVRARDESGFVHNLTASYEEDENGNQIRVVRDVAQIKGGPGGDALQFFVLTKLNEIVISVIGLFSHHEAIFTMTDGQDGVRPVNSTFHLNPL